MTKSLRKMQKFQSYSHKKIQSRISLYPFLLKSMYGIEGKGKRSERKRDEGDIGEKKRDIGETG